MTLTDDLVAYLRLDEASGNALDAVASADLTEAGTTVTAVTGRVDGARYFGSGAYFTRADDATYSTGDIDFTLQAWLKPDALSTTQTYLCKDDNGSHREYGFYTSGTDTYFYVFSAGGTFTQAGPVTLTAGAWNLVHGWHDAAANEIGIALNAGTPATASHSAGVKDGTAPFRLAMRGDGGTPYTGAMDEVGLWKRVLTGGERTSLWNGGAGLAYPLAGGGAAGHPAIRRLGLVGGCRPVEVGRDGTFIF